MKFITEKNQKIYKKIKLIIPNENIHIQQLEDYIQMQ